MRVIRFSKVSIATGRVVLVAMALALVFGMLVGALPEGGAAQPSGWPSTWIPMDTEACDCPQKWDPPRDVNATYYNMDSQYLYLRMCTCAPAGWNSTTVQGEARYKWWFDTNGTAAYVSGSSVYDAEFLLILEDLTDNSNDPNPPRDRLGELTLMDDLVAGNFKARWDSAKPPNYAINNPQTNPTNSTWWRRVLGAGTPGVGGPQGNMTHPDIGYWIGNETGCNYVNIYVSWAALGNPSQVCLIWATDNQNVNLDQAPDCDRPAATNCTSISRLSCNITCDPVDCADCDEVRLTANATGGADNYTYLWSTNETTQSINVTTSANYTVNVTDSYNHTTSCYQVATIYDSPSCNISCDPVDCADCDEVRLTANASNGTGPYTYLWSTNETTHSINVTSSGTYSVTVTDSNNCTGSCNQTATIYGSPDCNITAPARVCENTTGNSANTTSGYTSYSWSITNGTITSANNTYNITWSAGATSPVTLNVTVTDGACNATCSKDVTIDTTPTCNITCDPASCADCDQVRLTANATGGAGNYTYLWSTNETTQSINVTVSGNYSVTVTDSNNCTGSCNKTVTMYEHPTSCNVTCDPPTCVDPEQVTLTAHCTIGFEELPTSGAKATFGAGECTYLWSTGETTQSITVTSSGNYSVTVTAGVHECSKACSKIVTICKRPPAMVPAVNQWGIVAMIALFAGLVVWTVRKRRLAS